MTYATTFFFGHLLSLALYLHLSASRHKKKMRAYITDSHVENRRNLAKEFRGDEHGQQLGQVARDIGSDAGNVQGDDESKHA